MMRYLLMAALLLQEPILRLPSEAPADRSGPVNLDFEAGEANRVPPDWSVTAASRFFGYSTELRKQGCRSGAGCAVIVAGPKTAKGDEGAILQQFPAEAYQGQTLKLAAWVKLEGGKKGDRIKIAFTADGEGSDATHIQKGRGVDAAEWTLAEVEGKVPWHAETIDILISMTGRGTAWVDDIRFGPAK
jgi:hypothetical protein